VTEHVSIRAHPERCMGAGACIRIAPTYFGADDDGWVRLLRQTPAPEDLAAVRTAAAACPTASIDIDEADGLDEQQLQVRR
jgi:ferredoxin